MRGRLLGGHDRVQCLSVARHEPTILSYLALKALSWAIHLDLDPFYLHHCAMCVQVGVKSVIIIHHDTSWEVLRWRLYCVLQYNRGLDLSVLH